MYLSEVHHPSGIFAKVVLSSVSPEGKELWTLETNSSKSIDAECSKHRMISTNSSSSRAIPYRKLDSLYVPPDVRQKQSGMQGKEPVDQRTYDDFRAALLDIYNYTHVKLSEFKDLVHKQHLNRYVEPWTMQKKVWTATEWDNFFTLRLADGADPNIRILAECMRDAMAQVTPKLLQPGEWHLPYVYEEEFDRYDLDDLRKISAGRCARVSYDNIHSENPPQVLADRLLNDKHCYSEGTEVLTRDGFVLFSEINENTLIADIDAETRQFVKWQKPNEIVRKRYSGNIYAYPCGLEVTPDHTMIASVMGSSLDRFIYKNQLFYPAQRTSSKAKYKTMGEQEMLVPKTAVFIADKKSNDYIEGQLIGFYIGDGYTRNKKTCFRLVKKRKINYLLSVLDKLNIEPHINTKHGDMTSVGNQVTQIEISMGLGLSEMCGSPAVNKHIPFFAADNLTLLAGIFDGLKNSDGSIKRNTWVYSTTSKELYEQILAYAPLIGIPARRIRSNFIGAYYIGVDTKKYHRINDSRTNTSRVNITHYDGTVYCASVDHGALIVKKNGNTFVSGNCTPFEMQATPMKQTKYWDHDSNGKCISWEPGVTHVDRDGNLWSGNLCGWVQNRQLISKWNG